jgi:uncharacterized MnhB-related membrane protein
MIWYIFFVVLLVYLFSNQIMIYRRDLYICVILMSLDGGFFLVVDHERYSS